MPVELFMKNVFPPSRGLEMIPIDISARAALHAIPQCYAQIRTLSDEYEIALLMQRIADLKAERQDYVEFCWLHNRWRRS